MPVYMRLPGYRCAFRVHSMERKRNHGPVLTLAVMEAKRDGCDSWNDFADVVTRMLVADALSHLHALPVNSESSYGTYQGRARRTIGRTATDAQLAAAFPGIRPRMERFPDSPDAEPIPAGSIRSPKHSTAADPLGDLFFVV